MLMARVMCCGYRGQAGACSFKLVCFTLPHAASVLAGRVVQNTQRIDRIFAGLDAFGLIRIGLGGFIGGGHRTIGRDQNAHRPPQRFPAAGEYTGYATEHLRTIAPPG
jgi:hypothetical protein